MINFIMQEATEKATDIKKKAIEEANIEKEKAETAAKEKIRVEFTNKKEQYEIQKRIEKSVKKQ